MTQTDNAFIFMKPILGRLPFDAAGCWRWLLGGLPEPQPATTGFASYRYSFEAVVSNLQLTGTKAEIIDKIITPQENPLKQSLCLAAESCQITASRAQHTVTT